MNGKLNFWNDVFPIVWPGLIVLTGMVLIFHFTGWMRLMDFKAPFPAGKEVVISRFRIGAATYGNMCVANLSEKGLALRVRFPFAAFHPTVLIPRSAIVGIEPREDPFYPANVLRIQTRSGSTVTVSISSDELNQDLLPWLNGLAPAKAVYKNSFTSKNRVLLFFFLLITFLCVVAITTTTRMRSSVPYRFAVSRALEDDRVLNYLGGPFSEAYFPNGSLSEGSIRGDVHLIIRIKGTDSTGELSLKGKKESGIWTYQNLMFTKKTGEAIDLLIKPSSDYRPEESDGDETMLYMQIETQLLKNGMFSKDVQNLLENFRKAYRILTPDQRRQALHSVLKSFGK